MAERCHGPLAMLINTMQICHAGPISWAVKDLTPVVQLQAASGGLPDIFDCAGPQSAQPLLHSCCSICRYVE